MIQYLYARSLVLKADKHFIQSEAYQYFFNQSKKYWNKKNQYAQGMIALYLARNGEKITSNLIVEGLKQTAFRNDNLGCIGIRQEVISGICCRQRPKP
jgi:hypothetical protein